MSIITFPGPAQPMRPSLTVKALAKLMQMPAFQQAPELRDQKYPRGGHGKHRVPYYQPSDLAVIAYLRNGDVRELELATEKLNSELDAGADGLADQVRTRLKHNLRVLELLAGFPRLREATTGSAGVSQKLVVGGIEIRSTPRLHVSFGTVSKRVFLHAKNEALDEDEARRTLELASWVESDGAGTPIGVDAFEYWMLSEGEVLSWPTTRKRTVPRALQTLPILAAAWDQIAPPKTWQPQVGGAVGDADA